MRSCALCKQEAVLINSHLVPASAYRHVRGEPESGNGSPITIDGGKGSAFQSDAQITQELLCGYCEDLFSKNGERIIGQLWCTQDDFPLLELIRLQGVIGSDGGFSMHDSSGIESKYVDGLIYFAISVFWRAHVWDWTYKTDPYKKALGAKYEAELRRFLIGESRLNNVFLLVHLNTNSKYSSFIRLPCALRVNGITHHLFSILGIEFSLFLGGSISDEQKRLAGSNKVMFASSDFFVTNSFDKLGEMLRSKVSLKGKLARKHAVTNKPQ